MKKFICLLLILTVGMVCATAAFADMGVQVIGGPETETRPISLDDVKLNVEVDVPGFGTITPTSYAVVDFLRSYRQGTNDIDYSSYDTYSSGTEADYAILRIDILNTRTTPANYLDQVEVKVISDDLYEFAGWCYQYNYDNKHDYNDDRKTANTEYVINPSDNFSINSMYIGHYAFGCTLPNTVINAKTPLRMVITIGGNEITYNIRK